MERRLKQASTVCVCVAVLSVQQAQAQTPPVAARVDGEPIFVHEVQRHLERAVKIRNIEPAAKRVLQARTLEQLIRRRLILRGLKRMGIGASAEDIDLEVGRVAARLKQEGSTIAEYLEKSGQTEGELRRSLAWELGWQRYLKRYVNDANLQKYFASHKAEFDGRQIATSHILFKFPDGDAAALEAAVSRAEGARKRIESGDLSFADAARQLSQAPTGRNGGDIGLISRHEPMPESYARAAFGLKVGEVSQPVVSPFGVHLILCREIKPGKKTWQDARQELTLSVVRYLFDWVSDKERDGAKIEFTGRYPHFKPGTHVIAGGESGAE